MTLAVGRPSTAKEPVSPIRILAGYTLKYRYPSSEPYTAKSGIIRFLFPYSKVNITKGAIVIMKVLAHRPSKPSIRLTALGSQISIKEISIKYRIPGFSEI